MQIIAHNIRSLHNVGSVFRSADAFGVLKIYLTGYTGTPPRKEIAKTALGSEDRVAWEHREDVSALITELKAAGQTVYALDNRKGAIDIQNIPSNDKIALVLGSEVEGVPEDVLAACDGTIEILLPGAKRSLNVSVATGIALFALTSKKE